MRSQDVSFDAIALELRVSKGTAFRTAKG